MGVQCRQQAQFYPPRRRPVSPLYAPVIHQHPVAGLRFQQRQQHLGTGLQGLWRLGTFPTAVQVLVEAVIGNVESGRRIEHGLLQSISGGGSFPAPGTCSQGKSR